MSDERFMRVALELAEGGEGYVNPNPLVGAVVVKDEEIVGRGFHKLFGGPHAEVFAIEDAGTAADGATLYVTLEPCIHYGKTPPCTERIIEAGLSRVVIGCRDPNPLVNGKGIARLREAGIEVTEGVMESQARRINEIFFRFITGDRPFVQLKLAESLDGKIATHSGDSRWISSTASRREVHRLRRRFSSVLVGVNTVLADDPRLTVRHVAGPDPLRLVLDRNGDIPIGARLLHGRGRTIVVTAAMPMEKEQAIIGLGKDVWRMPSEAEWIDLCRLLTRLKEKGIDSVLIEGGGETAEAFLRAGLVDKVSFFIAPIIIGGRTAVPAIGGQGIDRIHDAIQLQEVKIKGIGDDLMVTGYVVHDEFRGKR
ncbi:MAG: bifunctional diaminohydroxyphosphoribosylaminopyrimidine deaminase/5-amino-6-(5-phosphoribosylamino)uracil reductase RibD [Candidatus Bipolaricaulota bacterium]|nr:bifunctional diaminohydroxyphosphoribosylaminopyrimidine deaminase/5-amino-6-(5-phosphoribosylamino)uracil reductase RibD [Candidatus Bipolaricaulota bacterium]